MPTVCSDFQLESDEKACETADNLETLEQSLSTETISVLVYIAGYITRKDPESSEESLLEQTSYYHQKYGQHNGVFRQAASMFPLIGRASGPFFPSNIVQCSKRECCV